MFTHNISVYITPEDLTLRLILSICLFWFSSSDPISRAMFLKLPIMVFTWPMFSSISSSRASFVILWDEKSKHRQLFNTSNNVLPFVIDVKTTLILYYVRCFAIRRNYFVILLSRLYWQRYSDEYSDCIEIWRKFVGTPLPQQLRNETVE